MRNLVRESFLNWIHQQTEHERLDNYGVWDSYYNGDQDVDIPAKVKAALESELGTRMNFARLVVDTPVDYILGQEFAIEAVDNDEAEKALYGVYRKNKLLDEEMLKLVTLMGKKGDVFIKLYIEDSEIKIQVLRPEIVFPRYADDNYNQMLYCAIKWSEEDEENPRTRKWKAQVFRADAIEYWELGESEETQNSQWEFKNSEDNPFGFIPIIHVKNTVDDLEFGVSDIQVMADLQDAVNKTLTDMLLTMDNQAFQRIILFGVQTPRGHEFSMEPGVITEVPVPEGHADIVPSNDPAGFIAALRELRDFILTITQTSKLPVVEPEVSHPASGFALQVRTIPLDRKCAKKKVILNNRLQELNQMIFKALAVLQQGDYTGCITKIHFGNGLPVDEMTQSQVNDIRIKNRTISRETVMEKAGIEDIPLEMERIKKDTDEDIKTAQDSELAKAKVLAEAEIERAMALAKAEAEAAKEVALIEAEKDKELARIAAEAQLKQAEQQMRLEAEIEVEKARELAALEMEQMEKQAELDIKKAKALAEIETKQQIEQAEKEQDLQIEMAEKEQDLQIEMAEKELELQAEQAEKQMELQQEEMARQAPASPEEVPEEELEEPAEPVEEE